MPTLDCREIDPAYFPPRRNYSYGESCLFKKPTTLAHFKERIDALIIRENDGTLAFLDKGDGILYLALKLHVLNLIPTKNKALSNKIYVFMHDKFGKEGFSLLVNDYASYIEVNKE